MVAGCDYYAAFHPSRDTWPLLADARQPGQYDGPRDKTLLTPEAFQFSDSDGDGKISSLEMADRRSFSVIDADRDEFVKFEEYVKFLRIGPERRTSVSSHSNW